MPRQPYELARWWRGKLWYRAFLKASIRAAHAEAHARRLEERLVELERKGKAMMGVAYQEMTVAEARAEFRLPVGASCDDDYPCFTAYDDRDAAVCAVPFSSEVKESATPEFVSVLMDMADEGLRELRARGS